MALASPCSRSIRCMHFQIFYSRVFSAVKRYMCSEARSIKFFAAPFVAAEPEDMMRAYLLSLFTTAKIISQPLIDV